MSKLQCCLCLVAITVSLVGCSGNSKMEPKNLLVRALTLPTKLPGTSKYETAMDMLMRRIESTDQYRDVLEHAQVQGKGVSRCLVVMRVVVFSGFGANNKFMPGIERASDEMFATQVVGVFERGGKVGFMSHLGEIRLYLGETEEVNMYAPDAAVVDGWIGATLCPRDRPDYDRKGWAYEDRLKEMGGIRDALRRATDISRDGVTVSPSPWQVADGADFFLVSVGNGDHVHTSIGINGPVEMEKYTEALKLRNRIWSAVNLKRPGDRDPDKGPAPRGGD